MSASIRPRPADPRGPSGIPAPAPRYSVLPGLYPLPYRMPTPGSARSPIQNNSSAKPAPTDGPPQTRITVQPEAIHVLVDECRVPHEDVQLAGHGDAGTRALPQRPSRSKHCPGPARRRRATSVSTGIRLPAPGARKGPLPGQSESGQERRGKRRRPRQWSSPALLPAGGGISGSQSPPHPTLTPARLAGGRPESRSPASLTYPGNLYPRILLVFLCPFRGLPTLTCILNLGAPLGSILSLFSEKKVSGSSSRALAGWEPLSPSCRRAPLLNMGHLFPWF